MNAQPSAAVGLPALYRSILEGIADLERRGHHREATRLQAEATAAYSTAWDERAARRLDSVKRRIARVAAGDRIPTGANAWFEVGRALLTR